MTAPRRLRDQFADFVPSWLSDRGKTTTARTKGYTLLWAMIAPLDAALEVLLQGIQAAWPGVGTPTALARIGASRGILRGQGETAAAYAERLRLWLDTWRTAGSQLAIARAFHDYLEGHPRVRVVNRSGRWTTVEADGSVTTADAAWDWDSVSHPERAGYWWNQWVMVYPTPWAQTIDEARYLGEQVGLGHKDSPGEYDALRGLLAQWKSQHTHVRAVIWTTDETLFDPEVPASCPDGTWGAWGTTGSGSRVASGRNTTTCRYWET